MHPRIIQASPEAAFSTWPLARAVAQAGQLGVVTGTVLAAILARRLQLGDVDGHLRLALERFPFPGVARRAWDRFFIPGGKPARAPFELIPQPTLPQAPALVELTVLANFVEVFLAKHGHDGLVGAHYAGAAQIPLLPSLYGALLAGADYLLVTGFPKGLPATLEQLCRGEVVRMPLKLADAKAGETIHCDFDPASLGATSRAGLRRPKLIALVPTAAKAERLARDNPGALDGVILAARGVGGGLPAARELPALRALEIPFWLSVPPVPALLEAARQAGAAGVMLGSAFAFCVESPLDPELKRRVIARCREKPEAVFTTLVPSPLGFPFKLLLLEGTVAAPSVFEGRHRICDVGYGREAYRRPDGSTGYRCAGEPLDHYAHKGGSTAAGVGQRCICNGLLAAMGLGQIQSGQELESAMVPAGDDVRHIPALLPLGQNSYRAADVVRFLLGE